MSKALKISDAEWELMQIIWQHHPITAREVVDALPPHRGWSERTVKTLLGRLVKKDVLGFEVEGKRYRYHPLVSREDGVRAESESFIQRVFGGATSPMLAFFLREGRLSPEEVDELRQLLDEQESES